MEKLQKVIEMYCNATNLSPDTLIVRCRKREIVEKRIILINILRKKCFTFVAIGEALQLDHSTVHHHVKIFEWQSKHDAQLRNKYETILNQIP